ncbi:uncharacterized protein LOC117192035 isoform X2 [Drosophila miranda]|uniref:uncharacterized protein LOC117192035 isoform X2 n=1 Tax=Drosophila miranda TaxID=7229 RepID=UPI00143F6015|nr:uncharacterized protein LOC117192035 isoform X2 [Drosophila miranda]
MDTEAPGLGAPRESEKCVLKNLNSPTLRRENSNDKTIVELSENNIYIYIERESKYTATMSEEVDRNDPELKYLSVERNQYNDPATQAEWTQKRLVWVPHENQVF